MSVVVRDVPRVFLAHGCKFDGFVHPFARRLVRSGVKPYVAEWDHQPGTDLTEKAFRNLGTSDGLVLIWSESASQSERVAREYAEAQRLRLPILLLLPVRGVDRPSDWGDREFVQLKLRKTLFGWVADNQIEVDRRAREFAFACLADANHAARGSPQQEP